MVSAGRRRLKTGGWVVAARWAGNWPAGPGRVNVSGVWLGEEEDSAGKGERLDASSRYGRQRLKGARTVVKDVVLDVDVDRWVMDVLRVLEYMGMWSRVGTACACQASPVARMLGVLVGALALVSGCVSAAARTPEVRPSSNSNCFRGRPDRPRVFCR